MSSASTTSTYGESVASCRAPSHPQSPAEAVPRAAVRRQLDFGGELDDDEDDFLFRAAEETERSHYEAKCRGFATPPPLQAPAFVERQCICGRGACNVEQGECGRWAYVCPATPKCRYSVWCGEADICPNPQRAFMSYPKPNPHVFNSPSCCGSAPMKPVISPTINTLKPSPSNPKNYSPTCFSRPASPGVFNSPSNHLAGARTPTPSNLHVFNGPRNPHVSNSPRNPHMSNIPSNHRTGAATPVNASPQGTRPSDKRPTCHCGAGKCTEKIIKGQKYYVCCIQKGQGACSYRVLVNAFVEEPPQTANNNPVEDTNGKYSPVKVEVNNESRPINPDQPEYDEWPFDIVNNDVLCSGFSVTAEPTLRDGIVARELSSTQNQSNDSVEVKTPTKSPVPLPHGSGCCFRCGEDGHWSKNCPKLTSSPLNSPCFRCGKLGHWRGNCPAWEP
ncbi:hypothetical protein E2562_032380 [Oryza meyeriana var. granulata]|uniref:CCHC-type domain-containing protein n=1 Tax=Oryza meyeriana var. granulata TaxID=110450 RepID=A0A6G1CAD3_9ORYZ|nr:hypothetical protein E2562_032380 [Oryza meyeriana var. granulata]